MQYREIKNTKVSLLGMGCMRFPLVPETNEIDYNKTEEMVKYAMEKGVDALILNGKSRIYLVDSEMEIPREKFDYVSLIPCTETVTGVYTLGLKYEINGRDLVKSSSLGISNEFYNNTAKIKIESGLLYVVCTQE